jgi:inositol 2-dehydrogenase
MKIKIGIVGAGRMGNVFAHHLSMNQHVAVAAIADSHPEKAQQLAADYAIPKTYSEYGDLLAHPDLEAVVIATSTHTHPEIIKAAAAAQKHIFCEKPLALTLQGCDEAIAAVEKAGVKMQIGFMRRFDPPYLEAKRKIAAGEIGQPVMFKAASRDPKRTSLHFARRENSGGLIMDMGVHDFDAAGWLMGSAIQRVSSEGGCLVYPELQEAGDIDNAIINLKFENGAPGNIDLSRNAVYGYDIRTEILGSEGSLWIGKLQQTALLTLNREGVRHDTVPYFMERFADAYAAEIKAFVECIRNDQPPACDGRSARMATAAGLAATISLDENRPVNLAEVF